MTQANTAKAEPLTLTVKGCNDAIEAAQARKAGLRDRLESVKRETEDAIAQENRTIELHRARRADLERAEAQRAAGGG